MTRKALIYKILIQIYGGPPTDDSDISDDLVNVWVNEGVALAAKQNYKDAIQIDGMGYINNSFYATYSGLAIVSDTTDNLCYKLTLPQLPLGIGRNEGVATLKFKDSNGFVSLTGIPLSINQQAYADNMPVIPNKIMYWPEGNTLRMKSALQLWNYTGIVKMVSAGDSTDLNSTLLVPDDYIPVVTDYVSKMLLLQRSQPVDTANDGLDKS